MPATIPGEPPVPPRGGTTSLTSARGQRLTVRHLTAADAALLVDLWQHLSPESRQRRFFQVPPSIADADIWREARRHADVDPMRGIGLVATVDVDGCEQAVGVARIAWDPEGDGCAELAVVVRDDYQGQGLGLSLCRMAGAAALARGIHTLEVNVLPENRPVLHMLRKSGLPHKVTAHPGEMEIVIHLVDD